MHRPKLPDMSMEKASLFEQTEVLYLEGRGIANPKFMKLLDQTKQESVFMLITGNANFMGESIPFWFFVKLHTPDPDDFLYILSSRLYTLDDPEEISFPVDGDFVFAPSADTPTKVLYITKYISELLSAKLEEQVPYNTITSSSFEAATLVSDSV